MTQDYFIAWLNGFIANKKQLSIDDLCLLREELNKVHIDGNKYIPSIVYPKIFDTYYSTC